MKSGAKYVYGAKNKYSIMKLNDIKSIPIQKICEDNALLFLWIPSPLLPEGIQVIESFGFKYKFSIYWNKDYSKGKLGMGFWMRNHVEILAVGIKGKIKPSHIHKKNIISHKVLKHSEKPEIFANIVEEISNKSLKNPKYIELFARKSPKQHWKYIGYEITGNDIVQDINTLSNIP